MSSDTQKNTTRSPLQMSIGAGIAIAVIWILMSALSAGVAYFMWLQPVSDNANSDGALLLLVLGIAPIAVAYIITKKILGIKD